MYPLPFENEGVATVMVSVCSEELQFDVVCDFIGFVPAQVERDIRLFKGRTRQYIYISSASAYRQLRTIVISPELS
ncbi:MAG: hypothetical protein MJY80_07880 [Bacteroidales bacterium]|nr:hypothetical protein [Bacteroidales bacterium]